MHGSYSQSFEDTPGESWEELVDWNAVNPLYMGAVCIQYRDMLFEFAH